MPLARLYKWAPILFSSPHPPEILGTYKIMQSQEILPCELYCQITTLQLNESACKRPLVETDHQSSWYEGIEGCGIQCENPIFTSEEHTRIHRFVGAFGSLSFTCSLFTMVLYNINRLVLNYALLILSKRAKLRFRGTIWNFFCFIPVNLDFAPLFGISRAWFKSSLFLALCQTSFQGPVALKY